MANAEFIQHLKSEIESLKEERNNILSDFVKDNICSSYESGVVGESEMLGILQSGPWDEVLVTNKKDHSGDFIIKYKNKKYIIDVNSGIYNPNTNMITREKIHQITVSGKSTLLLSNASLLNQEFINSILLTLYCETTSDNNTMVTDNCKREIVNSIRKMEREIDSEKKSFQQKITRKQNDLDNLKNTLKEIINGFDELSEDDSPKAQLKLSVSEMRNKLLEGGYIDESKLKGNALKIKYNELFND